LNIQNWRTALIESEMTDKAKLVGLVLSVYWNNKGKIYPSLTTLENDCSLTKNTIIRAVAELTDNNFVTVTKEHHRKSSFKINTYLLTGVTVAPMNDTVNEPMIDRANEPMIDRANEPMIDRANEPSIDSVAIAPMNAPELDIKVFKGIKEKDTIVSKKKAYSESFETFWKAYCRPKDKGSKPDSFKEWQKLTESEQQKAIDSIIPYKNSQSSPEYMKHAERYLKSKAWEGINYNEEESQEELEFVGGFNDN